ncbi:diaminopimelate epimerase [Limibaculum sp. M0105]|uniref:Diaminopimelate epimerase n=1 Tax=Thermohalobaculum xanthum TaxID=2753746 RepID=A0A8J7M7P8_9RHOB|nr:diaminopimelate epimerase [Thermohalobaculum xanthum]MBK0399069.1 diaminopimelate epimerase [Thermohalobaculum xanthum]
MSTGHDSASPGLAFRKMHGLGNDFVIIDARGARAEAITPALARALGDRHRGVGFDQLAVIGASGVGDARIDFWNADGTRAGACGNATRCVAHLLMSESGAPGVTMLTGNGQLAAWREPDGRVTADMGPARLDWREIPLAGPLDTVSLPIEGAPGAVSMGNPHCVFFVDDVAAVELSSIGPRIEHHALFPERTNVEFAEIRDRHHLRLRVWERGTGITQACGSGACATVVAGVRKGLLDPRVTMELDGGVLDLEWREDGHVLMTGPVAHVFEGHLSPQFLAGIGA